MAIFDWFKGSRKRKMDAAVSKLLANGIDYAFASSREFLEYLKQPQVVALGGAGSEAAAFAPDQVALWKLHGEFLCFYLHLLDRRAFEMLSADCRQELLTAVPLLSFPSLAPKLAGGFTSDATQFAIALTQTYRQRQLEYGACKSWRADPSGKDRGLDQSLGNNIWKVLGHPDRGVVWVATAATLTTTIDAICINEVVDSLRSV
jgi:hypothetical protein